MIKLKTRRKKTDRQKQEALLDELYREYIRRRAMNRVGGCERCHTPKRSYKDLQTCHIHSCRKRTTRWDPRNAFGGCGGCHQYLDSHIDAKAEFAKELLGEEEYDRLYVLAEMTTKSSPIDYKLIELSLKELLKQETAYQEK